MAVVLATSLALAAGNLRFASRQSGPTVRIHGGEPASHVLRKQIGGPLGRVVGLASAVANFPARALDAWRHGTGLAAYDRLVGVHYLGELYPGLNSFKGKVHDQVSLEHAGAHHLLGFLPGDQPKSVKLADDSARILIGLNRRDAIKVRVRASTTRSPAGSIELRWNGKQMARGELSRSARKLDGTAAETRRGTNVLEIRAAPGTAIHSVDLLATGDPRGDKRRPARR